MNNMMKSKRMIAVNTSVSNDTQLTGLNNNDLIIGSSGSGKTGGYVVPNLQNPSSSMVVSDTKGTLYNRFKKYLRSVGYDVKLIDFVNPENSDGYNPLKYIRRRKDGSLYEVDIKSLATTITPQGIKSTDPFWDQACIRWISAVIGYVLEALPEDEHTMPKVCDVHRMMQSARGNQLIEQWCREAPDSYSAKKLSMMKNNDKAEKTFASIMEIANNALDPFDYAEFKGMFEKSDTMDLRSLARKKTVLFLNTSDNDPTFDILTNIFHTQLLQVLIDEADKSGGELKIPVRIVLDDFAASAQIPNFAKTISIIRSRGISVSIILQSSSQLSGMYGHADAATIINNCDHILYLGGHDLATAEFIGTHMNKTAATALRLDRSKAILITQGEQTIYVDKIPPYSTLDTSISKNEDDHQHEW